MGHKTPLFDEHTALGARIEPFVGWDCPGTTAPRSESTTGCAWMPVCSMSPTCGSSISRGTTRQPCWTVSRQRPGAAPGARAGPLRLYAQPTGRRYRRPDPLSPRPYPLPPGGQCHYCRAGPSLDTGAGSGSGRRDSAPAGPGHDCGPGTEGPGPGGRPVSAGLRERVDGVEALRGRRAGRLVHQPRGLHGRRRLRAHLSGRPGLCPVARPEGRRGRAPCGLGARDTLRLEAGLNLSGQDMDEAVNPLESGLAWTIAWESAERDFIGRSALEIRRARGGLRRFVGLLLTGRGVLRRYQEVLGDDEPVGAVTSGGFSPTLRRSPSPSLGLRRASAKNTGC